MATIDEKRAVTLESPEIQDLLSEVMSRSETIKKREELSVESFRDWFCEIIEIIASKMGYVIQNLKEIPLDFAYSFGKGFSAGMENAKKNSYRYRDKQRGK
ncbi:MAG: hypothetical protein Q4C58_16055 [Eubacteriales bacterium]|nr:hypothetical protein [Eubacteriales bacterium]